MPAPQPLSLLALATLVACGSGIGSNQYKTDPEDEDGDGYPAEEDCDDTDAAVNPGATEVCNDKDDDCDDLVDLFDDSLSDGIEAFVDADGDGYGDPEAPTLTCDLGAGAVDDDTDCDDGDAAVNPDGTEDCATVADDDCDGEANEAESEGCIDLFADADGDGFGGEASACLCAPNDDYPEFFAEDCDDDNAAVNPDATEVCNDGVDNDCDGTPGTCEVRGTNFVTDAAGTVLGLSSGDALGDVVARGGDLAPNAGDEVLLVAPGFGGGAGAVAAFADDFTGEIGMDEGAALAIGAAGAGLDSALGGYDFDGDGLDDALIASREAEGSSGRVWLWPGPVAGTVSASSLTTTLTGPTGDQSALLGVLDDGDGDGAVELLVGSIDEGDVWVVSTPLSGAEDLSDVGQRLSGAGFSLSAVSGVGDLDGDGLDDLAVGAQDRGGTGRVWLATGWDGTLATLADADALVDGAASDDQLGASVTAMGDVTGDGYGDVVVGAPGLDWDSIDEGGAYLLAGPVTSGVAADFAEATFEGERSNDRAGESLSGGLDVNADGTPDLVLGCVGHDQGGTNAGLSYLLYGPMTGVVQLRLAGASFEGDRSRDELGASVTMAGDLDADGFSDLVLGAPGLNGAGDDIGAAYFVFGAGL